MGTATPVSAQEIVRRDHTADGRTSLDAAMTTVPIVIVQPGRQGGLALERAGIRAAVGPLPQQCLDKALGFAIGLGTVRAGPALGHAQGLAGGRNDARAVGGAVVAQ